MTGVLRGLIVGDRSFAAVRICLYGAVELGKVETRPSHSAGQMVTEVPVTCAAEDDCADLLDRPQALAAFGGSNAESGQPADVGCCFDTSPDFRSITMGSGFGGEYGRPSISAVRATSRRR